jgi:hypothetical protein
MNSHVFTPPFKASTQNQALSHQASPLILRPSNDKETINSKPVAPSLDDSLLKHKKKLLWLLYLLEFISTAGFAVCLPSLWPYLRSLNSNETFLVSSDLFSVLGFVDSDSCFQGYCVGAGALASAFGSCLI